MFTNEWWKAAAIRALRTFAQAAAAMIGTSAALDEINWIKVLCTAGAAAIFSILTSIATGLPEIDDKEG